MATRTPTIDSQVHAYERNRPERPWRGFLQGPDEVTGDDMVAAMDAVGVDGALLVSPFAMYGYEASYALEVYAKHPGKFGLIKPFDPQSESIADEMAEWTGTPGVVGARIMLAYEPFEAEDPGLNRILAAGAHAGVPVNIMCSGKLPLLRELVRRHPDTQVVIDHVGLVQPFVPPPPPEPFADLANVISLAEFDNVAIKISGACTLSHEPFPYPDIWGHLSESIRRVRLRPVHVGHRLDTGSEPADLRAGRRGVSGHRPAFGLGALPRSWAERWRRYTTGRPGWVE